MKKSTLVKFDELPLGARFTYPNTKQLWVKLENGGRGLIAGWDKPQLNWVGQSICSFEESAGERAVGMVEWIDQQSGVETTTSNELLNAANAALAHFIPTFPDSRAVDDCLVRLAAAVHAVETGAPHVHLWRDGSDPEQQVCECGSTRMAQEGTEVREAEYGDIFPAKECSQCPWTVGDTYRRDCAYPACSPPWKPSEETAAETIDPGFHQQLIDTLVAISTNRARWGELAGIAAAKGLCRRPPETYHGIGCAARQGGKCNCAAAEKIAPNYKGELRDDWPLDASGFPMANPPPSATSDIQWIKSTTRMPPQGVAVLMRRTGSEQIPMWEWRPITETPFHPESLAAEAETFCAEQADLVKASVQLGRAIKLIQDMLACARDSDPAPAAKEEPKNATGMTDEKLIGYCEIHCETERALFNETQVNRMIELAGYPEGFKRKLPEGWYSLKSPMRELVKLARARRK